MNQPAGDIVPKKSEVASSSSPESSLDSPSSSGLVSPSSASPVSAGPTSKESPEESPRESSEEWNRARSLLASGDLEAGARALIHFMDRTGEVAAADLLSLVLDDLGRIEAGLIAFDKAKLSENPNRSNQLRKARLLMRQYPSKALALLDGLASPKKEAAGAKLPVTMHASLNTVLDNDHDILEEIMRAWCLIHLGRYQEAEVPLTVLRKEAPNDPWVLCLNQLQREAAPGDLNAWLAGLAAIARKVSEAWLRYDLFDRIAARGAPELAEQCYRTLGRWNPPNDGFRDRFARFLMGRGRYQEALPWFADAARRSPIDFSFVLAWFTCLLEAGQMGIARAVGQRWDPLFLRNIPLALAWVRLEAMVGNIQGCFTTLENLVKKPHKDMRAAHGLGELHLGGGTIIGGWKILGKIQPRPNAVPDVPIWKGQRKLNGDLWIVGDPDPISMIVGLRYLSALRDRVGPGTVIRLIVPDTWRPLLKSFEPRIAIEGEHTLADKAKPVAWAPFSTMLANLVPKIREKAIPSSGYLSVEVSPDSNQGQSDVGGATLVMWKGHRVGNNGRRALELLTDYLGRSSPASGRGIVLLGTKEDYEDVILPKRTHFISFLGLPCLARLLASAGDVYSDQPLITGLASALGVASTSFHLNFGHWSHGLGGDHARFFESCRVYRMPVPFDYLSAVEEFVEGPTM